MTSITLAQIVGGTTIEWGFSVALVMILSNLFAVIVGRFAIKNAGVGPDLPVGKPAIWKKFGIPELLATASLGHILGAGMILGLANAGVI